MPGGSMGTPAISMIMTRPAAANARFIGQLRPDLRRQLTLIESPLIDIVPVPAALDIKADDAVIFTSENGVRFAPNGQGRQAFCVGHATTQAAGDAGWQAVFCGETSEALVVFLTAQPSGYPRWHIAGKHTRGRVMERLAKVGRSVTRVTVYDQALRPLTKQAKGALVQSDPVIVPIFSPRTARQFVQECPGGARPHLLAFSEAVAAPMADLDVASLEIVPNPDVQTMLACLEKRVARISLG